MAIPEIVGSNQLTYVSLSKSKDSSLELYKSSVNVSGHDIMKSKLSFIVFVLISAYSTN